MDTSLAREFLKLSRGYLIGEYLPKIERCLGLLSDEQIWWRSNENTNSIGNLLLHLSGNVRQYIVSAVGESEDIRRRPEEFAARSASREELQATLRSAVADSARVLERLHTDELQKTCTCQGHTRTKFEAIYHAVEHFSMHTGQIILITKQLSGQDLSFYAFEDDKVERRW